MAIQCRGAKCQDASCFMFRHLEQLNLGVKITIVRIGKSIQRVVIAFVNDTNFCTNGPFSERKMHMIIKMHFALHEATGGKIQQSKIVFYFWQWVCKNG